MADKEAGVSLTAHEADQLADMLRIVAGTTPAMHTLADALESGAANARHRRCLIAIPVFIEDAPLVRGA